MRHALILSLMTALVPMLAPALPAAAQDLPQGLQSARFLPGWTDAEGRRVAALELVLEPGWKTYWRSPGDAGLAPEFDWKGSNIGKVDFIWPAPELVVSGGMRTLGFHDRLVLPFTVTPEQPGQPVGISAQVTFGLCENICIPAQLDLVATPAGPAPDPVIEAAMKLAPVQSKDLPACEISEIEDGMTVTLSLPPPGGRAGHRTQRRSRYLGIGARTVEGRARGDGRFRRPQRQALCAEPRCGRDDRSGQGRRRRISRLRRRLIATGSRHRKADPVARRGPT